jgi:outer membrane protein TolC
MESHRRSTRPAWGRRLASALAIVAATGAANRAARAAEDADAALRGDVTRASLVRAAVARSPAVRASKAEGAARALDARAEAKWPAPQAMVQLWKVPLAKPYAIGSADMLMVGVSQEIPPPGAPAARSEAVREQAAATDAMASDRARVVARVAEHAFADWVEATQMHAVHAQHEAVAERALAVARAKQSAGGPLTDVAQTEAERALVRAELEGDRERVRAARVAVNAILGREASAPLGAARAGEPEVLEWPLERVRAEARTARPDVKAAEATLRAREAARRGADREATWPSFNVALLYFAPVGTNMPHHGYGLNLGMSLPWLWGPSGARSDAAAGAERAAGASVAAAQRDVDVEIAQAYGAASVAARKVLVLRDAAIPAGRRALEAAQTGYESGRAELLVWLAAERSVVDAETELVQARARLDHALAELSAAAGIDLPRKPLGKSEEGGTDER